MKKLYLILFVISVTSCSVFDDDCIDGCTFKVYAYTRNNVPFDVYDYIEAPGGYEGLWGETLEFIALDPPGYKFVGYIGDSRRSYCYRVLPVVDPYNYRKAYVHGDIKNMAGCNLPNDENYITLKYVRTN